MPFNGYLINPLEEMDAGIKTLGSRLALFYERDFNVQPYAVSEMFEV